MPLKIPRLDTLGIFIYESEYVYVRWGGPLWGALSCKYTTQKPLIEPSCIFYVSIGVTICGPPNLSNNNRQRGETILFKSSNAGVKIGVKNIGIGNRAIHNRLCSVVEEGIFFGEIRVGLETKEWVDVDGESATIVTEKLDDGEHEAVDVGPEVTSGGKTCVGLVDVSV